MTTHKTRGFTLIELLVVIAIIGILASVVLASLNTARDKGADAAIRSNLNNARAQAELYYDDQDNSYAAVCDTTNSGNIDQFEQAALDHSDDVNCTSTASTWAMEAQLSDGATYYCVDSTGKATEGATQISGGLCP